MHMKHHCMCPYSAHGCKDQCLRQSRTLDGGSSFAAGCFAATTACRTSAVRGLHRVCFDKGWVMRCDGWLTNWSKDVSKANCNHMQTEVCQMMVSKLFLLKKTTDKEKYLSRLSQPTAFRCVCVQGFQANAFENTYLWGWSPIAKDELKIQLAKLSHYARSLSGNSWRYHQRPNFWLFHLFHADN